MATALESRILPDCFRSTDTRLMFMMAAALGLKDRYTEAHARRVADYAGRLADRLGMQPKEVQQIKLGGMLHDLGKLALSDRVFSNQKTALSTELLSEVRTHPLIGAALLKHINCMEMVCDAVLYHHERIDGSGYPFGLEGDAIPLGAKIVSVADCFDAITTDRPYQRSKSCEQAFHELGEIAGTSLSAELVPLFIDEIRHNGMEFHPRAAEPDLLY